MNKLQTEELQKAIEKTVDEDTATLPLIPLTEEELSEKNAVKTNSAVQVNRWFFTFMCMNIPIAGWIYLFYLGFSKTRTDRRGFARAYLFYKLLFLLISLVILGITVYIGMGFLDQLLAYMEML